ncbi:MAG TPA: PfkB family carbohydrate kinase [Candidatus Dormibacteraeota bacterium]
MTPHLLVAGSVALDTLEGAFGHVEDELGGSAVYFSLAASLVRPVSVVAPVGEDGFDRLRDALAGRDIDLGGVSVLDAPTYRWKARDAGGRNLDLGNRDSIYDRWTPAVPERFAGWAFVSSMRPDRQLQALRGLRAAGATLLAADAMLSYVRSRPDTLTEILGLCDWYFCNQDELQALGGSDPEQFRRRHRMRGLVVKSGPGGIDVLTEGRRFHLPALVVQPVVDSTGAGDSVAGAMLARWSLAEGDPSQLEEAARWGVACASITIEEVGLRALRRATPERLRVRVSSTAASRGSS